MSALANRTIVLAAAGALLPLLWSEPACAVQLRAATEAGAPAGARTEVATALADVERELAVFETVVADLLEYAKSYPTARDIRTLAAERETKYAQVHARQSLVQVALDRLHIRLGEAELRQSALFMSGVAKLQRYPAKRRWKVAREAAQGSFGRESESILSEGYDARERQRRADRRFKGALASLESEKTAYAHLVSARESLERDRALLLAAVAIAALAAVLLLRRRAASA